MNRCKDGLYSATTLVLKDTGSEASVPRHELKDTVPLLRYDSFCARNLFMSIHMHALKTTCPARRMLDISHFSLFCYSPHAVPQVVKLQVKCCRGRLLGGRMAAPTSANERPFRASFPASFRRSRAASAPISASRGCCGPGPDPHARSLLRSLHARDPFHTGNTSSVRGWKGQGGASVGRGRRGALNLGNIRRFRCSLVLAARRASMPIGEWKL
jgi:hypothetical protein